MKTTNELNKLLTVGICACLLLMNGCSKENTTDVTNKTNTTDVTINQNVPTLKTNEIIDITISTAKSGGVIEDDGDSNIIKKGICWSASKEPTLMDNKTEDGTGSERFTSIINNLDANTTYYVRAYATNQEGTAYGNEQTFKTLANIILPTVETSDISNITKNTAQTGGTVGANSGPAVTAFGVCWSTKQNPTLSDSKTNNGTGIGSFSCKIEGLQTNTTYYLRAYATNSNGTAYGEQKTFTTALVVIDIDGNEYNTVKIGNQTWMTQNLRTKKYKDGTSLALINTNSGWANMTTGACTYYDNDTKKDLLYNWYAVETGKLCPAGWHIPTVAEWETLITYLTEKHKNYTAKTIASPSGWLYSSQTGAPGNTDFPELKNVSGFSALPSGIRGNTGDFAYANGTYWWAKESASSTTAISYGISNDFILISKQNQYKQTGCTVRCIKD